MSQTRTLPLYFEPIYNTFGSSPTFRRRTLLFPQFHVDKNGAVNFAQTDVLIHVVNKQTNRILDVERSNLGPAQRAMPCSL